MLIAIPLEKVMPEGFKEMLDIVVFCDLLQRSVEEWQTDQEERCEAIEEALVEFRAWLARGAVLRKRYNFSPTQLQQFSIAEAKASASLTREVIEMKEEQLVLEKDLFGGLTHDEVYRFCLNHLWVLMSNPAYEEFLSSVRKASVEDSAL